jgi:hypothetical protein
MNQLNLLFIAFTLLFLGILSQCANAESVIEDMDEIERLQRAGGPLLIMLYRNRRWLRNNEWQVLQAAAKNLHIFGAQASAVSCNQHSDFPLCKRLGESRPVLLVLYKYV